MLTVSPYDCTWPTKFEKERQRLLSIVQPWISGSIEHVGSTSVPGLAAKPIIDIMLGVESLDKSREAISVLTNNSYCYAPYKEEVMHWFCKPSPELRTHHLHLIPFQSRLWNERIKFRDILRSNQEIALAYQQLKLKLAKQYSDDREQYTIGKGPFVQAVLAGVKP